MKKSLGQHFLKSAKVLDTIIQTAQVKEGDLVLEIGPGAGALTKKLLAKKARVIAVEKDRDLPNIAPDNPLLEWIYEDIRDFHPFPEKCKVIANIPYYLSSPILELLLEAYEHIESITLLVQKEFAEKILSQQSFLSLHTHLLFEPRIVLEVGRHHFYPPPKVTSAILHCTPKHRDVPIADFLNFARQITRAKRKTLKSLCPDLLLDNQTLRLGECSFDDLLLIYKKKN